MGQVTPCSSQEGSVGCVFCGNTQLSETDIWPNWVDQVFPDAERSADLNGGAPEHGTGLHRIFSLRPRIVCNACSQGWTRTLDEQVRTFLVPALHGDQVDLSPEQTRQLAGWLCLTAVKAAFVSQDCGISKGDRTYLRHTGEPPRNWSIFAAGLSGSGWSRACQHHPSRIEFSGNPRTTHSRGRSFRDCNTQLLSIGIGPLFFHIFSSPSLLLLNDFNASSKAQGLVQLWPAPRRFGLLPRKNVKVPPDLSLSDEQAAHVADLFTRRLRPAQRA